MADIFSFLSSFFNKTEGVESINTHFGRTDVQEIILKAELVGKEKHWFDLKNGTVKIEPSLIKFGSSKRLLWFVYFLHTQKDWQKSDEKIPWMRFALVKIDDKTGEVLFADFVKLQIV